VPAASPAPASAASASAAAPRAWRGVVGGFYGEPWSHAERLAHFRFAAEVGLTRYVYAPKFDAHHRERWRDPYPADDLAALADLVAAADAHGIEFVYAISPGLSMRCSGDADHDALAAKLATLWAIGVRHAALLFDDVPLRLPDPADRDRFGDDERAVGVAHGHVGRRLAEGFLRDRGVDEPLLICPTDYAGTAASPYRDGLAETLPADARVMWTGADIVVGAVSRADIDAAAASYERDLVLWDNFPVNDFDRSRVFLGPLVGRTADPDGSRLVGAVWNPMPEAAASRFGLAAAARWAADPGSYDPAEAAVAARRLVAGDAAVVGGLAPLLDAMSGWPPSAPAPNGLGDRVAEALAGDGAAVDAVELTFAALAAVDSDGAPDDVAASLSPWIAAARDTGAAAVAACDVLRARAAGDEPGRDALAGLDASWHRAAQHHSDVLRALCFSLVEAALGAPASGAGSGARVLVLTGANPAPGDRELAELLASTGRRVTLVPALPDGGSADAVRTPGGTGALAEPDEIGESPEIHGSDAGRVVPPDHVSADHASTDHVSAALGDDSPGRPADEPADPDLVVLTPRVDAAIAARVADLAVPVLAWGHLDALGLAEDRTTRVMGRTLRIVAPGHPLAAGLTGEPAVHRAPGLLTGATAIPAAEVIATAGEARRAAVTAVRSGALLADGRVAPAPRVTTFLADDGLAPWLVSPDGRRLVVAAVDLLLSGELDADGTERLPADPGHPSPEQPDPEQPGAEHPEPEQPGAEHPEPERPGPSASPSPPATSSATPADVLSAGTHDEGGRRAR
jgi:hypothetical protein